jgi:hypothetical protein
MGKSSAAIEITEEQALAFRARRGHLAGPGAKDARAAARAVLGAQCQQINPGLLALSMRTRGRPSAAALEATWLEAPRALVRTWGQRGTLHLYDPGDWPLVIAARQEWPELRRGVMPPDSAVRAAKKKMQAAGRPLTRKHLFDLVPKTYVRALARQVKADEKTTMPYAAGRLLWQLARSGEACTAGKEGAEQAFALREHWYPELDWSGDLAPRGAAVELTRRYLAAYGPATANDVAHFFGARVASARQWVEVLAAEGALAEVRCGDRQLVALRDDVGDLRSRPAAGEQGWPLRLLPLWDTMLMGHADKSWILPDEREQPLVWRKAAFVAAVVLARGRIVATWSHEAKGKKLAVTVEPLSGWRAAKHQPGVRREAAVVARHLGCAGAEVTSR